MGTSITIYYIGVIMPYMYNVVTVNIEKDKPMKLKSPLIQSTDDIKTSFVDISSLSEEEKALVETIDKGNAAEASLVKVMHTAVGDSEFSSTEIEVNPDKGSYLRVATIESAPEEGSTTPTTTVVAEFVNGHLTETMQEINDILADAIKEANTDVLAEVE